MWCVDYCIKVLLLWFRIVSVLRHLHDISKTIQSYETATHVTKMFHFISRQSIYIYIYIYIYIMHREKARRELHKNSTSYIDQILEATFHETTPVRLLITHLEKHPRRTRRAGQWWRSKDELINDCLQWSSTKRGASIESTFKNLQDLLGVMDDKDRWRVRENRASSTTWWYIYIYIYILEKW